MNFTIFSKRDTGGRPCLRRRPSTRASPDSDAERAGEADTDGDGDGDGDGVD